MLMASYSDDGALRVWDLDQRRELRRLDSKVLGKDANITASSFSHHGEYLALGLANGTAHIWDVRTGAKIGDIPSHEAPNFEGSIKHISFSPDGRYVITGSTGRTARLWETNTGKQVAVFPDHEDWVTKVVFDPEGKHLITVGGGVRLWDAESGEMIFSIPKDKLGFIFDSYLVAGGRILMVMDSREISILNMFPSNRITSFPTTSTLVDFAKKIPLAPLTDAERKRFFIPLTKKE